MPSSGRGRQRSMQEARRPPATRRRQHLWMHSPGQRPKMRMRQVSAAAAPGLLCDARKTRTVRHQAALRRPLGRHCISSPAAAFACACHCMQPASPAASCCPAAGGPAPEEEGAQPSTSGRGLTEARDPSGGPAPLHPSLVTLALLPRSQWQGLVHLDAIKVGGWRTPSLCRKGVCFLAHHAGAGKSGSAPMRSAAAAGGTADPFCWGAGDMGGLPVRA